MMIERLMDMMMIMMSKMVTVIFNRKKLDVCVYLMSAVAVQMEVKHQDNDNLDQDDTLQMILKSIIRCKCRCR